MFKYILRLILIGALIGLFGAIVWFMRTEDEAMVAQVKEMANPSVTCDESNSFTSVESITIPYSNVCSLNASFSNLREFPKEVFAMTGLKRLDVSGNIFSEVPAEIGNLSQLEFFNIMDVDTVESLPAEIGKLTSLQEIHLGGTAISALPETVSQLVNLEFLDIMDTAVAKLPDDIGNLKKLQVLDAEETNARLFTDRIATLSSLRKLNLANNGLDQLPESFRNLQELEELNLFGNNLSHIPQALYLMPNLKKINLASNPIDENEIRDFVLNNQLIEIVY